MAQDVSRVEIVPVVAEPIFEIRRTIIVEYRDDAERLVRREPKGQRSSR